MKMMLAVILFSNGKQQPQLTQQNLKNYYRMFLIQRKAMMGIQTRNIITLAINITENKIIKC